MFVYDDMFTVFRAMLFVFLAIYTALRVAAMIWQLVLLLRGQEQHRRLLRVYLAYQLLSIRWRRHAGELAQIGMWAAVLVWVWRLHAGIA